MDFNRGDKCRGMINKHMCPTDAKAYQKQLHYGLLDSFDRMNQEASHENEEKISLHGQYSNIVACYHCTLADPFQMDF